MENFILYSHELAVDALERAYQEFKDRNPLPTGVAFSLGDNDGEYSFLWEDIVILHHLPTYWAKNKYYNLLVAREDFIKGTCTAEDTAKYLMMRTFR